jgi:hypothetical protein
MIQQKRQTRFAKKNPKIFLLGHKEKFGIITVVTGTCPKNRDRKYHNVVHNNAKPNNPNIACSLIKILTIQNKLKRKRLEKYLE